MKNKAQEEVGVLIKAILQGNAGLRPEFCQTIRKLAP